MTPELILCIPGPWRDRSDLVATVISTTNGEFMFAGMILAHPAGKDHVPLDFAPPDPQMRQAFETAGQGKLPASLLDQIAVHQGVAYLHFPVRIMTERVRAAKFTETLRRCGGLAVKVESAGIAHEWDRWLSALRSEDPYDLYRSFVVLVGAPAHYFSCGMHHFGLPDVQVDRSVKADEAADLMNQFNFWQIVEMPKLASGHTFSLTPDAPKYQLILETDSRHEPSDLFHNPHGLWSLRRTRQGA